MTREIKFRYRYNRYRYKQSGATGRNQIVTRIYNLDMIAEFAKPDDSEVILSRDEFTGLKDKNGTEIYESDILLVPTYPTESNPIGEPDLCQVVWETGAFGYKQGGMFESFVGLLGAGCETDDESEVIGNVHQSPELIQ